MKSFINWLLSVAAWGYFAGLWSVFGLRVVFHDRWWWLGYLNSFTPYWFVPLLFFLPFSLFARRRGLSLVGGLSFCLFTALYADLFLPRLTPETHSGIPIRIMTYNILGTNRDLPAILHSIEQSKADVVSLQELSPEVGAFIEERLASTYPYQVLSSQDSVISRYPITLTDTILPGNWNSPPQIYHVEVEGRAVTLINAHFFASVLGLNRARMNWVWHEREEEARVVADYVAQLGTSVIVSTDFNASDQSYAYGIMTSQLRDAWREGGWGFGHTFPGGVSPGMWRPVLRGQPWPMWLVRIDYLFHSDAFWVVQAALGEWDGVSDHRPVVVDFELQY